MGQQQLLLLILGVIIVGVAIAVGIGQFGAKNIQTNKDGVTASLVSIGADAYRFRQRPASSGGGGDSYVGYAIPSAMARNDFGEYSVKGTPTAKTVSISGKSTFDGTWIATCTLDSAGHSSMQYSGW